MKKYEFTIEKIGKNYRLFGYKDKALFESTKPVEEIDYLVVNHLEKLLRESGKTKLKINLEIE